MDEMEKKARRKATWDKYNRSHKEQMKAYRDVHKEERNAYNKARNLRIKDLPRTKDMRTNHKLLLRYGITIEDKQRMCEEQGGKCFVCAEPFPSFSQANVDHNHATQEVRKLLCRFCNQALGMLKENPELIRKLADYAEEYC